MAVLRALGGGGILENNIVQTGASAGSSIASGVIFTVPALVILGYWTDFKYWWVLAIAGLGGMLGVLFSVPLRRSLIVDQQMAFPEGKAAAEVLKAGENPAQGVKVLGVSALAGGLRQAGGREWPAARFPTARATAGFIGKFLAYLRHQSVAGAARRGLHRGAQHRHRGAVPAASSPGTSRFRSTRRISWMRNPELAAAIAAICQGLAARMRRGSRCERSGARRSVISASGAMLVGGLWALVTPAQVDRLGREEWLCAATRAGGRGDRAHRARPADEVGADRHRAVHAAARGAVLQPSSATWAWAWR